MENIVIKGRIVLACSFAIRRKSDFQQLGLHRLSIDHDIDPIDCSAVAIVHLRVFGGDCDEHIPEHFLYFLVDGGPVHLIVVLELFYEILVFNLFEVRYLPIIHYSELSLIGRKMSAVNRVVIIS